MILRRLNAGTLIVFIGPGIRGQTILKNRSVRHNFHIFAVDPLDFSQYGRHMAFPGERNQNAHAMRTPEELTQ